jgi:hypothetical protein
MSIETKGLASKYRSNERVKKLTVTIRVVHYEIEFSSTAVVI